MDIARRPKDEQTALWNGLAGRAWVEAQELIDELFKPIEEQLIDAAVPRSGLRVLDVGCGAGATTIAAARRLGATGACTGIDIAEPMIDAARARAHREGVAASFIRADAESHAFERATFDRVISRFGVMFFADPVHAFANLRRAATDEAELRFVAWRSAADNPFMTTAERAAAPLLPNVPPRRPDAPGQFAFADERRVRRILEEGGWVGIDIRPMTVACTMPERELVRYFTKFGPLGRVFHEVDEPKRAQIIDTVRAAFDPYVHGSEVRFTAACWFVAASASPSKTTSA